MKQWLLYPVIASTVTAILHFVIGLPIGWSAFAAFVVWPVAGTIITSDEDLPGGWANPDGAATPPWETPTFWGQLCGGCAISALAFAAQLQFAGQWLPLLATLGALFAILSVWLLRRAAKLRN